jgi:hypothetical protein
MSHFSVQTKLHYYDQKQVQFLSVLSVNKCILFLYFLNKGSTEIFCYLFSSILVISLKFPFIHVLLFFF